ncbi:helix-turn-helix domain-containing protein [Gimesia sp.]|uniref:helix-turn-helix domain-containing protein n=1 Tax=Gimesia sp. TaxID=2024833 RepID=UPI0025B7B0B0|nr:helix-turn-helix domain-containing protein [Gimesia sp.]|tara:strand:+ start:1286 stop:1747 length:462 start_codon:yes stop_codon:yes gene_type:complete
MSETKLDTSGLRKLDLNCIYPSSEIMRITGADKEVMKLLKRDGLEFRWLVGDQWIKAIDLWNMMKPVFNKYAKQKAETSELDSTIADQPGLATYAEVAEFLKIGQTTLYHLVKDGQLKVVYIGARPRIEWSELEKYLKKQRTSSKTARRKPKK